MMQRRLIVVAVATLVAFAGCDKKSSTVVDNKNIPAELQPTKAQFDAAKLTAPALFAHIPADTPYVLAAFEPVSLDYYAKLKQGLAPMVDQFLAMKRAMAEDEKDILDIIVEEMGGKFDVQSVEALGFSATPRFALYGIGLVPAVVRLEIRDEAVLKATVERIATKAGETLPAQETKDGKSFWRIAEDDMTFIVAIADKQLIGAFGPTAEVNKQLDLVLGIQKPAQSMADGKALIEVMTKHGFGPQLVGYLDMRKLAAQGLAFSGQQVPAACGPAIDALAAKMPRIAIGYGEISGKRVSGGMVVELDAALLAEVGALRTDVPGLGAALSDSPLMAMGGGVDIAKGAAFLKRAATAARAVGETCQSQELVEMASEAIDALSQPIPDPLTKVTGFAAAVHEFKMGQRGVEKLDGFGMVTATSAKDVVNAVKDGVPLDMIGLTTDGKLNKLQIPAGIVPGDVLGGVGDKAIVVGTGTKGKALAERGLKGSASGKSPFFVATYDYGRFMEIQAQMAQMGVGDPGDQIAAEMSKGMGNVFGRANFSMDVNDKGLVMWAALDLK